MGKMTYTFYDWLFADQPLGAIVETLNSTKVSEWRREYRRLRREWGGGDESLSFEAAYELSGKLDLPWAGFVAAEMAWLQKRDFEAQMILEAVARTATESRVALLAWSNLRRLGVVVPAEEGQRVLGVVAEVPQLRGVDVLAAYADDSARFQHQQGGMLIWEEREVTITPLIRQVIQTARCQGEAMAMHCVEVPPAGQVRITFLTPGGLRCWEGNPDTEAEMNRLMGIELRLFQALVFKARGTKT